MNLGHARSPLTEADGTTSAEPRPTQTPPASNGEFQFWREHTTIALQPVAAPSILGLFGFAVSTFMVSANLAGWFGSCSSPRR